MTQDATSSARAPPRCPTSFWRVDRQADCGQLNGLAHNRINPKCGLAVREIIAREVETLNLRVYGWADAYVFGKSQEALACVRIAARRRPADVIRPKPFCQVALLDRDPDDASLADANRRRGWPAHVHNANGELRDYIVILQTDRTRTSGSRRTS